MTSASSQYTLSLGLVRFLPWLGGSLILAARGPLGMGAAYKFPPPLSMGEKKMGNRLTPEMIIASKWIIAQGNFENGFVFIGSFDSYETAIEYDKEHHQIYGGAAHVQLLRQPIEKKMEGKRGDIDNKSDFPPLTKIESYYGE